MLQHSALLSASFLGFALILIPLTFHLRNRNVAVICLCLWLSLFNLIVFINGILWNGSLTDDAPLGKGYCDISSRIQLTTQPALMGCAIAILRYLSIILSAKGSIVTTRAHRARQTLIDLAIIFTVPILVLSFQLIIYREPRYDIISFVGCSVLSLPPNSFYMLFIFIWAPIMGVVAVIYACMIIHALNKKRRDFREILRNSQSGIDVSRFARLFIIAFLAIFIIAPIDFYQFYEQVQSMSKGSTYRPHGNFSTIAIWYFGPTESQLWSYWFAALVSILFAALFGLGRDAFSTYRQWLHSVPGANSVISFTTQSTSKLLNMTGHSRNISFTGSRTASSLSKFSLTDPDKDVELTVQELRDQSHEYISLQHSLRSAPLVSQKSETISSKRGLPDTLTHGHNHKSLGTASSRIWMENSSVPISPNKIKVQSELSQRFDECTK